eukprot:7224154-Alexandrium_andersonii.AAC.1
MRSAVNSGDEGAVRLRSSSDAYARVTATSAIGVAVLRAPKEIHTISAASSGDEGAVRSRTPSEVHRRSAADSEGAVRVRNPSEARASSATTPRHAHA